MSMAAPGPYNWSPNNPIPYTWDLRRGYTPGADAYRGGWNNQEDSIGRINRWVGDAQKYAASRGYQLNQDTVNRLSQLALGGIRYGEEQGGMGRTGFNWGAYGPEIFANTYNPGEAVEYVMKGVNPTHQGMWGSAGTPAQTPPAAPGAAQQQPPGVYHPDASTTTPGASGGLTAAQKAGLADDPQQAFRYAMQQIGMNPDAPGMLGKFLQKRFQPLLEARMAASNVGSEGNYLDTIDSVIKDFASGMTQKGGNFYGNLAGIANQAGTQGADYLNRLQDQSQAMQYLSQLASLRFAGANPLVQQSAADEMDRARAQYQDTAFQNELAGRNIDPFIAWLRANDPWRFRTIYGQP